MSELTKKDIEVLDKIALEAGYDSWENMKAFLLKNDKYGKGTIHDLEKTAVLARLAETERCQKEIDKLINSTGLCHHCRQKAIETKKRLSEETK